jgi:predicted enzyme related to lactoylglutathione lyase
MDMMINIDVPDIAKALAFYTEGLGLTVGRRLGPEIVEVLGASSPIYLLTAAAGSTATATTSAGTRNYGRHWTPVHLDLVVPDLDAALARAKAAGAIPETPIRTADWGKIVTLSDPFGNGFCLVQFLNRGYDEIAAPKPA